jgi:hypothetical protein
VASSKAWAWLEARTFSIRAAWHRRSVRRCPARCCRHRLQDCHSRLRSGRYRSCSENACSSPGPKLIARVAAAEGAHLEISPNTRAGCRSRSIGRGSCDGEWSAQVADMIGTLQIAPQLTGLGEIPRRRPVRRDWRDRRRKAGRLLEQTARFAHRISSGRVRPAGMHLLASRTHPDIHRHS